jgi:hypothetical protein
MRALQRQFSKQKHEDLVPFVLKISSAMLFLEIHINKIHYRYN